MAKHKTREEWIELFLKYEKDNWDLNDYYKKYADFSNRVSEEKGVIKIKHQNTHLPEEDSK